MTAIGFYHLTQSGLDAALPRLLEKVVENRYRALVLTTVAERVEYLNRALWTYSNDSFLPHGSKADGHMDKQPILITDQPSERANNPNVLVCVDGADYGDLSGFERCLDLFDGNDPIEVQNARARWKSARDQGHELVYWQQNEGGGWTKAN